MKKTKKQNFKKGIYTSVAATALLVTPFVADQIGVEGANVFENKASALEGNGNDRYPYLVYNAADLVEAVSQLSVSTTVITYIELKADVDLTGVNWIPKGTATAPVMVDFDGKGHTIKGLTINSSSDYQGLFGHVKQSIIENVSFDSPNIKGGSYTGVAAGKADYTQLRNITVTNPKIDSTKKYVGGVVGQVSSARDMKDLNVVGGTINSAGTHVGGIAGEVQGSYDTRAAGFYVNADITSKSSYVGGFAGAVINKDTDPLRKLNLSNIAVDGSVSGTGYVGGIAGQSTRSFFNEVVAYNAVRGTASSAYVGGLLGQGVGPTEVYGFVGNSEIIGVGKNVGLVFGGTTLAETKTEKYALASEHLKNTTLHTEHLHSFQDFNSLETFYRFNSSDLNSTYGSSPAVIDGFSDFYFDVPSKKIKSVKLATDEELVGSFSSAEYQTSFNTLKSDMLDRLAKGITGSSVLSGLNRGQSSSTNYLEYIRLLDAVDSQENKETMSRLIEPIRGAQGLLGVLYKDWSDFSAYFSPHIEVFKDKDTGAAYLNTAKGEDFVNGHVAKYKDGKTDSKTLAMIAAFEKLHATPSQSNYYDFMVAAEAVKVYGSTKDKDYLLGVADTYKRVYGFESFEEQLLLEAIKAVEEVEKTLLEEKLNEARAKVALVKNPVEKESLTNRLNLVEASIQAAKAMKIAEEAVANAESSKSVEDFSIAQEKVTALPESAEKDALQARLNALKAEIEGGNGLNEATEAVAKAEGSRTQADVDVAQEKVTALKDSPEKQALQDRLDALKAEIGADNRLDEATKAVEKAEAALTEADVADAQTKVTALKDSPEKDALQARLNDVKSIIANNVLFQTLNSEVKTINKGILDGVIKVDGFVKSKADLTSIAQRSEALINADHKKQVNQLINATLALMTLVEKIEDGDKSIETINQLPDSAIKNKYLAEINMTDKEMNRLYDQALKAVVKAENSKLVTYLTSAIKRTDKVLAIDPRKQDLINRIEAIQLRNEIANISSQLDRLEARPSQAASVKVEALINQLPDSVVEKVNFVNRLNNVKQTLDSKNYEKALKAVESAENSKVDRKRTAYNAALELVYVLLDGERKTDLNNRLIIVLVDVEAWEKLDGDYMPGDHIVEVAESIKTPEIKKHLLAWAKAIHDAEKNNSSVVVNNLAKVKETIPSEVLNDTKYADLIKELVQRTEHVQVSNNVFSGLTQRSAAKKAYIAVANFEKLQTEVSKEAAQKAVNDLKRFNNHESQVEKFHARIDRIEIEKK